MLKVRTVQNAYLLKGARFDAKFSMPFSRLAFVVLPITYTVLQDQYSWNAIEELISLREDFAQLRRVKPRVVFQSLLSKK